jgi:hypothetical protein
MTRIGNVRNNKAAILYIIIGILIGPAFWFWIRTPKQHALDEYSADKLVMVRLEIDNDRNVILLSHASQLEAFLDAFKRRTILRYDAPRASTYCKLLVACTDKLMFEFNVSPLKMPALLGDGLTPNRSIVVDIDDHQFWLNGDVFRNAQSSREAGTGQE